MTESYRFAIDEEGQSGLTLLEKTFNPQTQYFLQRYGLKPGMQVLDIGCGAGIMTQYLAEQVGENGVVVAIDNNENQVKAAQHHCPSHLQSRIQWQVGDIYALEKLAQKFDLIYCRFVLHHVHRPRFALAQIATALKPGGLYIGAEGIVHYAFTNPPHAAWQGALPQKIEEGEGGDGNIGKIVPQLIAQQGMECLAAEIFQPILLDQSLKNLLLVSKRAEKEFQIAHEGLTEAMWQHKFDALSDCVNNPDILIGFYGACFFAARNPLK